MRQQDYQRVIARAAAHAQRTASTTDDRFATFAAHLAGGLSFYLGDNHATVQALSGLRQVPRQSDLVGETPSVS